MPDYHELHEVCTILHGTDSDIRLEVLLASNVKDSQDEKHRVLLALLHKKHFTQARRFADRVGLTDDQITLKEVGKTHALCSHQHRSMFKTYCIHYFCSHNIALSVILSKDKVGLQYEPIQVHLAFRSLKTLTGRFTLQQEHKHITPVI